METLSRFEQFEATIWELYALDSYYDNNFVETLTKHAYPEFKDYRIKDCEYCRHSSLIENPPDEWFCSDDHYREYGLRTKGPGITLPEISEIMKVSLDEKIAKINEHTTSIFEVLWKR